MPYYNFIYTLLLALWMPYVPVKKITAQPLSLSEVMSRISPVDQVPEQLLSSRSAVIYNPLYASEELNNVHTAFRHTGIDTEIYFRSDHVFAGIDFTQAISQYLTNRKILYIIFLNKENDTSRITIAPYNHTPSFVNSNTLGWDKKNIDLSALLIEIFQQASADQPKMNHLITEFPETHLPISFFYGNRVNNCSRIVNTLTGAVPAWTTPAETKILDSLFKESRWKYKITDPSLTDDQLRKQGYRWALRFVHSSGAEAWKLIGHDINDLTSTMASMTYVNKTPQMKTLTPDQIIYKFYIKELDYGDVYLGRQWDADIHWVNALHNHLQECKHELLKKKN